MSNRKLTLELSDEGIKALDQLMDASIISLRNQEALLLAEVDKEDTTEEQLQKINEYLSSVVVPQIVIALEIQRECERHSSSIIWH